MLAMIDNLDTGQRKLNTSFGNRERSALPSTKLKGVGDLKALTSDMEM